MLAPAKTESKVTIIYPESDGQPMADNSRQFHWILVLVGNLAALFRDRQDVLVGGNQFWYPVEGEPEIRLAPDVYVVFGRPKGERGFYQQWLENNLPMTVVFEILSPGNSHWEMVDKFAFYEDHGAEEYYLYDPDHNRLSGYVRHGTVLVRVRAINGFVSPRLGIRFDLSGPELVVRYPDGRPFLTFEDLAAQRDQAEQRAARLAELSRRLLRQEATPEEVRELDVCSVRSRPLLPEPQPSRPHGLAIAVIEQ
jgi:Uma2 family endonuclease